MPSRDTVMVLRNYHGGWSVRHYGAKRAARRFATKEEAVEWGRERSRNRNSELYITGFNGRVERRISYLPDDPSP